MKRFISLFLPLLMCFGIVACSSHNGFKPKVLNSNIVNVKRSNDPFDNSPSQSSLNLSDIYFETNNSLLNDPTLQNNTTRYSVPHLSYTMNNVGNGLFKEYVTYTEDEEDFTWWVSYDNDYNYYLNVQCVDFVDITVSEIFLNLSVSDDYLNSYVLLLSDIYSDDDNSLSAYDWYSYDSQDNRSEFYVSGSDIDSDISYFPVESDNHIGVAFECDLNFSNSTTNTYQTIKLGKFRIKSLNFNFNGLYVLNNDLDSIYKNAYDNGFFNGKQSGIAIGTTDTINNTYQGLTYNQIYNNGYNNGYSEGHNNENLLPDLFGSIVNIPISVLNGLVPLTFFDISIIRLVITFMSLGVILWLIRKVVK